MNHKFASIKNNILKTNLKNFKKRPTQDEILYLATREFNLSYKEYSQFMELFQEIIIQKIYYWEMEYNISKETIK